MKIYYANINDYETEYLKGYVSDERRVRSLKYRHEKDIKRSLLAEALLNLGLKEKYTDIIVPVTTNIDEYSKPHVYYQDKEVFYSVSHSGDYAVCALSDSPVGIDIETIKECNQRIVNRFFAKEERGYVTDDISFYNIWTLKESFMKITGLGMKLPMDAFSISYTDEEINGCIYRVISDDYASEIAERLNNAGSIAGKVLGFEDDKYALSVCGYIPIEDIILEKVSCIIL